ncbi:hypothetical protein HYV89_01315 [Candidatus Woesearchaeota archaeon]|nr:hypothetical protein [Candidatus Woesearchaeota archaeon]
MPKDKIDRHYKKIRDRERIEVAESYRVYARRFYDAGYREDAYLFAEIGLKLDSKNKKLKDLISRLS